VESLAECAKGTLRRKKAELTQALQARISEHQRFMLRAFMEDLEFVERKIARIEETIRARMAPHEEVINRLNTIPGVNQLTASTLIAELGVQMQQFPDAMHLASWAGLCPGDCESAGKRKNTRTRKGNPHVRRVLCQAAWAAAHTKLDPERTLQEWVTHYPTTLRPKLNPRLQYGLLRGSFVPPQEIRELRELTRYRVKLLGQRNQVHNRIEKLLQQANVKLSSVATDILGVTGRRILASLLGGNEDATSLANCAKGTLRRKKDQLAQALQAKLTIHQRFMLGEFLDDLKFVEGKIARVEETIQARIAPHEEVLNRLNTISGINRLTASTLIAELGVEMQQFPDAMHLASWAGLCPGDCESAGKRKNTRTRKGNPHVRRVLCQAAWAAAHTKHSYPAALFYRIASRAGRNKALIAVARHLIVIAYHLIREPVVSRDLGENYFDSLHAERTKRRLVRRLEGLGHEVILNRRHP